MSKQRRDWWFIAAFVVYTGNLLGWFTYILIKSFAEAP